jgi:hypothetical protein
MQNLSINICAKNVLLLLLLLLLAAVFVPSRAAGHMLLRLPDFTATLLTYEPPCGK